MNTLVFDTASKIEIIAAAAGGESAGASASVGTSHSVKLLENIDGCLKKIGLVIADIDCIGVGTGPGSFTGIRIAVTTARMLSQLTGKPLVGLASQILYAAAVPAEPGENIIVAFDAKKSRVFGALYRKTADPMNPVEVVPPGDYPIGRLLGGIDPGRLTHLVGDGTEKYLDDIAASAGGHERHVGFIPPAHIVCGLVRERFGKNPDGYADYRGVLPFYARKSDAEAARDGA